MIPFQNHKGDGSESGLLPPKTWQLNLALPGLETFRVQGIRNFTAAIAQALRSTQAYKEERG